MNALRSATSSSPQKRLACFLAMIGLTAVISGACERTITFRFDNRTPATLCYYAAEQSEALGGCSNKVGAEKVTKWSSECGADQPTDIVLTVGETGQRIYSRTATCSEWNATDRTFVIEQVNGRFVVTGPRPK